MNTKNSWYRIRKGSFLIFALSFMLGQAQNRVESFYVLDKPVLLEAWSNLDEQNREIIHAENLQPFFIKLKNLYENKNKSEKLNIVHIGDSHIQAGFITEKIRDSLQNIFGNGGLGLTFPHRIAKSNGIRGIRYTSSAPWEAKRNLQAGEADPVGLSGFSLTRTQPDFALNLKIEDERFYFSTLKLFTPQEVIRFDLAETDELIELQNQTQLAYKTHTIRSGESLSVIAQKYGVRMAAIKEANQIRGTLIRAGAKLKIPVRVEKPKPLDLSKFRKLNWTQTEGYFTYKSDQPKNSIWFLPNETTEQYSLNGVFLENDSPGLIYSGIGVNGARFSDFNKTPLFFKQLPYLEPDLIVVSLGTNEAHSRLKTEKYLENLKEFIERIEEASPQTSILLTTPLPMLDRRTSPNALVEEYTREILKLGEIKNVAVWNQYEAMGGNEKIRENYNRGMLFKDFIHYSQKGYKQSGSLFTEALLHAFYWSLRNSTTE